MLCCPCNRANESADGSCPVCIEYSDRHDPDGQGTRNPGNPNAVAGLCCDDAGNVGSMPVFVKGYARDVIEVVRLAYS